jgi:serine protease inhibitor
LLLQTLTTMGIRSAFDAKTADFSRISDNQLMVTGVLQSVSG